MNIILFLNKDLEANIVYNLLKPEFLKHNVRIYYSESIGNNYQKPTELIKLEYFEKVFTYTSLPLLNEQLELNSSFEFFSDTFHSFPINPCANVNSDDFINEINSFNPDLFISVRFGKIFKSEIIRLPPKGLINLHSGILPDYKGIMGTLHTINNGSTKIGCTLHTITDSGIDTGEIIDIAKVEVNFQKSLFWNIVNLYPAGVNLIANAINELEQGNPLKVHPQDLKKGTYYSLPTESDFNRLKNLGMDSITEVDYLEVIAKFIFTDLSDSQIQPLKKAIELAFINSNQP